MRDWNDEESQREEYEFEREERHQAEVWAALEAEQIEAERRQFLEQPPDLETDA